MSKMTTLELVDAISKQAADAMGRLRRLFDDRAERMEARIAALEKAAGIEARSDDTKSHKPGDIVEMGDGKWLCRGAGRYRRVEESA